MGGIITRNSLDLRSYLAALIYVPLQREQLVRSVNRDGDHRPLQLFLHMERSLKQNGQAGRQAGREQRRQIDSTLGLRRGVPCCVALAWHSKLSA